MANLIRRTGNQNLSTLTEWDPIRLMNNLLGWDPFQEMAPAYAQEPQGAASFLPRFDVKETRDGYQFKADLPGVKDQDVDISLTGNRLTISGKREAEQHQEGDRFFTYERSYGSFSRSFTLPEGVNPDGVKAEMKDGVLTLLLPKRPELQPRKISLTGGGQQQQAQGNLPVNKGARA